MMQAVKTIIWAVVLAALLAFSYFNWQTVSVTIWNGLVLETKVPALVITAFLLGLLPTWIVASATRWRLNRRIAALEATTRDQGATLARAEAERKQAERSEAVPVVERPGDEEAAIIPPPEPVSHQGPPA